MFVSDRFNKLVARARKNAADHAAVLSSLESSFVACLTGISEAGSREIASAVLADAVDAPTTTAVTVRLAAVVDLFAGDYDEQLDPLLETDWDVVRDVVGEYAGEMDMDVVNYVMGMVLEKGRLE